MTTASKKALPGGTNTCLLQTTLKLLHADAADNNATDTSMMPMLTILYSGRLRLQPLNVLTFFLSKIWFAIKKLKCPETKPTAL